MDLKGIFELGRSKMKVLGGHIEVQDCFSYQRRTKCGPNAGFSVVFERVFGLCLMFMFFIFHLLFKETWLFEKRCFTKARASFMKVRCRFGGSRERSKLAKSGLGGVPKSDARQPVKIIKTYEQVQNTDPHEVLYIPDGFDVFTFCNVNIYRQMRANKLGILRSGGDFWTPRK